MLGAILGQAGTGEQTLLERLVRRRPGLLAGRVACSGRNFPGYDLITAIPAAGAHVIARVKEGIPLPSDGPDRGWLPDGSRMTWLMIPYRRYLVYGYGVGRVWKIGHPISVRHNESSRVSEGPTR